MAGEPSELARELLGEGPPVVAPPAAEEGAGEAAAEMRLPPLADDALRWREPAEEGGLARARAAAGFFAFAAAAASAGPAPVGAAAAEAAAQSESYASTAAAPSPRAATSAERASVAAVFAAAVAPRPLPTSGSSSCLVTSHRRGAAPGVTWSAGTT